LLAVDVALDEIGIRQFNFFVEDREFVVPLDELGPENVSLVSDQVVVFLLFALLLFR